MQSFHLDRQRKPASPSRPTESAQRDLAAAFASFNQTAGALETTYSKLQAEVCRLRHELENKNRSLTQSLEENERMRAYLARIVEGLPCGVLVFDSRMDLRLINPAASRMLHAQSEPSSLPRTSVPGLLRPLLAALPRQPFSHEEEWVVEGTQGRQTVGVTRACLQAGDSILILRDLTDIKQLESEREISRRIQALAEVATLLAHEIRNPLGSLELFAGLLSDALAGQAELQPWINHIQAGLRTLAATVNNVLHFHSQPSPLRRSIDLFQLVGETVEFLGPLARQKEMHIDWRAAQGIVPTTILADPSRLQQAFFNLAVNAFRAMQPGGTLSVKVAQYDGGKSAPLVAITFTDQGVGIPPENLEKVFDPGFTTHSGSPGLGLAVTRKVIEQHGGTIRVASRGGEGATFTLTLPVAGN